MAKKLDCDAFFEGLGMLAAGVGIVAVAAGLICTIWTVWSNNSLLDRVSDRASEARNQSTYNQEYISATNATVRALVEAYNKEHPDAKLSIGNILSSTGGAWTVCVNGTC